MTTFTVHEAKTNLSKLIEQAEAGTEVIITRGKKPVVKLTKIKPKRKPRKPGMWAGMPDIPDGFFFDPLPDEEMEKWGLT
jgi:prevent-host-death family protein